MSLYFSVVVWTSLVLGGFGLAKHLLPRYRAGRWCGQRGGRSLSRIRSS